jgi:hypothetical protein
MDKFLTIVKSLMDQQNALSNLNGLIADRELHAQNYKMEREKVIAKIDEIQKTITEKILNEGVQSLWRD